MFVSLIWPELGILYKSCMSWNWQRHSALAQNHGPSRGGCGFCSFLRQCVQRSHLVGSRYRPQFGKSQWTLETFHCVLWQYELIDRHGYSYENHTITTDDGYILTTLRIPHGKNESTDSNTTKPVALLLHGIWSSPNDLIIKGDESIGFLLAEQGYDVFLMASRGNTYSLGHVNLSSDSVAYWNFRWVLLKRFVCKRQGCFQLARSGLLRHSSKHGLHPEPDRIVQRVLRGSLARWYRVCGFGCHQARISRPSHCCQSFRPCRLHGQRQIALLRSS